MRVRTGVTGEAGITFIGSLKILVKFHGGFPCPLDSPGAGAEPVYSKSFCEMHCCSCSRPRRRYSIGADKALNNQWETALPELCVPNVVGLLFGISQELWRGDICLQW